MFLTDNASVQGCRQPADGPVCRAPPSPVSGYQKLARASRNFPRPKPADCDSLIKNKGIISVGAKSIGIYGHSVNTENDSDISVGNSGIGVYSVGGNLNLKGKLKVGTNEAKGVLVTGDNQVVTNDMSSITLEDNSFGIVDTGNNNKISSNTTEVSLGNKNVFLYSESTTGDIINNTKITTNGNGNFGIYTAGKASNTANMDLRQGLGNVGLYSIGTKLVSNSGTIKVGASDPLQRL